MRTKGIRRLGAHIRANRAKIYNGCGLYTIAEPWAPELRGTNAGWMSAMICPLDVESAAVLEQGLRFDGPITASRTTSNNALQTVQQGVGVARAPV